MPTLKARPRPRAVTSACAMTVAAAEFVNPFETLGRPNHLVSTTASVGLLIHAGPGSAGGSGALRTKRSGWVA